ncbi:MAG: right-handed parallel beta-helix repeat-containing protein, partial [Pirellulaceae bacterium]|nr:right-handed parallel beta-helix repeat-containing protein [Pirellulaceae bacterium]
DCRDATLSGLQVTAAAEPQGALILRRCRRVNVTGCTILDSDGCGILLEEAEGVRLSGCLVRDDRPSNEPPIALRVAGGSGNMIVGNMLVGETEIAAGSGLVEGNYGGVARTR